MKTTKYLVKVGKTFAFPFNLKTVGVFESYEEADMYITKNIKRYAPKHMYIEPVEQISAKDFEEMMESHIVVPVKGVE